MSVAAAVPRGHPPLLLDSTLVWARSAAFTSPQAAACPSLLTSPTCARSPAIMMTAVPPPAVAKLPSYSCDEDAACDAIGRGFGFDSDADGPRVGFCPINHSYSFWGRPRDLVVGQSEPKHCGCLHVAPPGGGRGDSDKAAPEENSKTQEVAAEGLISRWHSHFHTSTSQAVPTVATAIIRGDNGRRRSFASFPATRTSSSPSETATAAVLPAMKLRQGSAGGGGGPHAALTYVPAHLAPQQPSSPALQPIPLPNGRSSNRESVSGGGAGAATPSRRPAHLVKPSAMTSQICAAQRSRAATRIQAVWRGFRIRRLYLRLIVWRLRPPPQQQDTYWGIRELPPIPDLPEVSLFTQYGRPSQFRTVKRRVWFDLEGPFWGTAAPGSLPHGSQSQSQQQGQQHQHQQQKQRQQQKQQNLEQLAQSEVVGSVAVLPPTTPEARRPRPRVPLRLAVPPRAEADVPMSEVERILAGGFWRVDGQGVSGAPAGARETSRSGEGEEGLSLYMRAKMRQEEREAEDALQMLSYEPHDLMHKLGSLKERTMERLGSLGRTIGETLSSGLLLGGRGHGHEQRAHGQQQSQEHGLWHWHWHTTDKEQAGRGVQARSLPRAGRWGISGAASGRNKLYCNGGNGLLGGGGGGGSGIEWSLRLPLLTVVGADGQSHTEVPPGAVAIPIAINRQRYRNRSHVTRMSF
ncbi:hypothetical protein VaNZ11_013778 [Volvox africanus]|uniref:Uncharacterized protein n=1 Tax=Volvox africanus TaxID=51714 RepID=A0ABQ5SH55_9CHLO|nr:hypothetical protein VaNZ11_013778 [Volvox africanus]